jgi:hypothetical protein
MTKASHAAFGPEGATSHSEGSPPQAAHPGRSGVNVFPSPDPSLWNATPSALKSGLTAARLTRSRGRDSCGPRGSSSGRGHRGGDSAKSRRILHTFTTDIYEFTTYFYGLATNFLRFDHAFAPPLVDERGDQAGPAGLVRGAQAGAGVGMEELVEEEIVAPVGIVVQFPMRLAEHRPLA